MIKKLNWRNVFSSNSAAWAIFQQVISRTLIASKFFLVAKIAGPSEIGLAAAALAVVAFADSISDLSLSQAAVQQKANPSEEQLGALWTISVARGMLLWVTFFFLSEDISRALGMPALKEILQLVPFQLLLRALVNPAYFTYIRGRDFRSFGTFESCFVLADFIVAVISAQRGFGALAIIFGTLTAEIFRLTLSWAFFWRRTVPNFRWRQVSETVRYGTWLWLTGILISFLNQADKFIVGKYFGAVTLGEYQTSTRLAQLPSTDLIGALSNYLYPTIAQEYHVNPLKTFERFKKLQFKILLYLTASTIVLYSIGPNILVSILGVKWAKAIDFLPFVLPQCSVGALLVTEATFAKASGQAKLVATAMLVQLATLALLAPALIFFFSAPGMPLSNAAAGIAALLFLHFSQSRRIRR